MPIATRTFRVFVSSTFEDLKQERDALQREVFPKLRRLCEQHGARFQAIDLRWGVRDEAALDQQTMEICLREIRRCQATGVKPNFIVLLGDRYGWQPLPARIDAAEFNSLLAHMPEDVQKLARQWYRLDENAVPPEYCLQPRTGGFASPAAWNKVEQALREALAGAARAAGLPETALIKYEASATHQEILAGLGETESDWQHVFGFFRRPAGETDARLEELKAYLRARLPGNIEEFARRDLAGLCNTVFNHIRRVIESEVHRFEDRPALDLEVDAHDRFAEDRCRIFAGRQATLDTIADYLRGPERRPLVLYGESGSGKSAVMAKASEQYKGPGRLIRRFIGASPESASGHALLTSLCRQIAPGETPVDYAHLENAFRERLSAATTEWKPDPHDWLRSKSIRPLVLFIDALDQLAPNDPAADLTWLPEELPPHVKVIVSTTADAERLPAGLRVHLELMKEPEGGQVLEELLQEARRTLQPWQRGTVLAHFRRSGLPLYLKFAAEESKLWKSYASQDACTLGEGVEGVIDTLFDRLSNNANHGPTLVGRSMGYLAAARYGLSENEILDVLTEDEAVWNDFNQRKHHEVGERRLPVVVWSRLSFDLEPYLTERSAPGGTVVNFYHRQLSERAEGQFLAGTESQDRHGELARYFSSKPAWLDEDRKVPNARRAVELVFQQRLAQRWPEAENTLLDSQFLFAKVMAGMLTDLEADYQDLIQDAPEGSVRHGETLMLVQGVLRLSAHVVAQDPRQFASQMVGRLLPYQEMAPVQQFSDAVIAGAPRPWLRPLKPALHPPGMALVRTLELVRTPEDHSGWGWATAVAVSADGQRVVSASVDKTLKVWDLETGRKVRTLEGHSEAVNGVAVTPDRRRVVSASNDKTLKVWDLEAGRDVRTMEGHSGAVNGVAVTPDGRRAVSASEDRTLKVWDVEAGREVRTLEGHSDTVEGVAVTPDGRLAVSASEDDTLKVWDLETGRELRTLKGHSYGVEAVAVTPDGRRAVSASDDHTLKVWDLETGRELDTLKGHSRSVWDVAVTPDGRRAVSASRDDTLKVWNLETGRELRALKGHSSAVHGVALALDGRLAVSASRDGTLKVWGLKLRVWGLKRGREVGTLEGHSSSVWDVAVTPDGRRAVSASSDRTLKVWNLETGVLLTTFTCDVGVHCCAFAPDRGIVAGDSAGRVHFLALEE